MLKGFGHKGFPGGLRRPAAPRLAGGVPWLCLAALCAALPAGAQTPVVPGFPEAAPAAERKPAPAAIRASQPPAFSLSVEPLGFTPPGALYLGQNISFASLDFLDENHLLFTFRVPGLIRRRSSADQAGSDQAGAYKAGAEQSGGERHIRALVLALPSGAVDAETVWTLHDHGRYLWMLKDRHFLLRDGAELKQGDAALNLKPDFRFPGPVEWVGMDPSQDFLVAGTREPQERKATAPGTPETDDADQTGYVLRILHRDTGQVMLLTRLKNDLHLPINGNGYLESLRARGIEWQLTEHLFSGGISQVARLLSTCAPGSTFVSQQELVASVCSTLGEHKLVALTTNGRMLWQIELSDHEVWPLLVRSQNGARLAQETLVVGRPVTATTPLSTDDLKGQVVHVYDAANGRLALSAEVNPALDAGGNVAISPSGRRVAVLNGESLEIFELPPAPSLPDAADFQNGH